MFPFGERGGSLRILAKAEDKFHTKAQSEDTKTQRKPLHLSLCLCVFTLCLCVKLLSSLLVHVINDAAVIVSHQKRVFTEAENIRGPAVDPAELEKPGDEIR